MPLYVCLAVQILLDSGIVLPCDGITDQENSREVIVVIVRPPYVYPFNIFSGNITLSLGKYQY